MRLALAWMPTKSRKPGIFGSNINRRFLVGYRDHLSLEDIASRLYLSLILLRPQRRSEIEQRISDSQLGQLYAMQSANHLWIVCVSDRVQEIENRFVIVVAFVCRC